MMEIFLTKRTSSEQCRRVAKSCESKFSPQDLSAVADRFYFWCPRDPGLFSHGPVHPRSYAQRCLNGQDQGHVSENSNESSEDSRCLMTHVGNCLEQEEGSVSSCFEIHFSAASSCIESSHGDTFRSWRPGVAGKMSGLRGTPVARADRLVDHPSFEASRRAVAEARSFLTYHGVVETSK